MSGFAPTITATGGIHKYLDFRGVRTLTRLEIQRVMGFPDWYQGASKQDLGNAVVPAVVRAIFNSIRKSYETPKGTEKNS